MFMTKNYKVWAFILTSKLFQRFLLSVIPLLRLEKQDKKEMRRWNGRKIMSICRERGEKKVRRREIGEKEMNTSKCGLYVIVTEQNRPGVPAGYTGKVLEKRWREIKMRSGWPSYTCSISFHQPKSCWRHCICSWWPQVWDLQNSPNYI